MFDVGRVSFCHVTEFGKNRDCRPCTRLICCDVVCVLAAMAEETSLDSAV